MSNYPSGVHDCPNCGEVVTYGHIMHCKYPLVECAGCQELVHINSLIGDLCQYCYEDAKDEEGQDNGLLDSKNQNSTDSLD